MEYKDYKDDIEMGESVLMLEPEIEKKEEDQKVISD